MNLLLVAMLLPLHFTAPADSLGPDDQGRVYVSALPVQSYVFYQLASNGAKTIIRGYADSTGSMLLVPHAPGTRETVWLEPGPNGGALTFFMVSRGANGNLSLPSNGCVIGGPAALAVRRGARTSLDVPIVKQAPERCGPAALTMVLRYYGAAPAALREVDGAYDPVLHGSLITDLAGAARRAGFEADVATLTPDSLIELLSAGVPPILLYQNGPAPFTVGHFGVVTGWDATHASFTIHDGTGRPRVTPRDELTKRWETAGSQALIVRQAAP